jgi:hypothetical protein
VHAKTILDTQEMQIGSQTPSDNKKMKGFLIEDSGIKGLLIEDLPHWFIYH